MPGLSEQAQRFHAAELQTCLSWIKETADDTPAATTPDRRQVPEPKVF